MTLKLIIGEALWYPNVVDLKEESLCNDNDADDVDAVSVYYSAVVPDDAQWEVTSEEAAFCITVCYCGSSGGGGDHDDDDGALH